MQNDQVAECLAILDFLLISCKSNSKKETGAKTIHPKCKNTEI